MSRSPVARARAAVSDDLLIATLRTLAEVPAPPGSEGAAARHLARFLEDRLGAMATKVHADGDSADLEVESSLGESRHLGYYSHLDTSLTGEPLGDAPITGLTGPMPEPVFDATTAVGFGFSVARAPAAAALAGMAAAAATLTEDGAPHHFSVLLTGGGTHRAFPAGGPVPQPANPVPGFGAGAHRSLDRGYRPEALVNVKAAAPGVLFEEPGAMFVRMAVTGPMFPALMRRKMAPDGGSIGAGRRLLDAFERWRAEILGRPGSAQCGWEAAIGAIRAGSFEKVDLVSATFEAAAYVMFPPGVAPSSVAADLRGFLESHLDEPVEIEVYAGEPGGATASDAEIVRLAREVWDEAYGQGASEVTDWTGSTDGAIFRNAGIDTVRIGLSTQPGDDPRTDVVSLEDLRLMAEMYAAIGVRYATGALS